MLIAGGGPIAKADPPAQGAPNPPASSTPPSPKAQLQISGIGGEWRWDEGAAIPAIASTGAVALTGVVATTNLTDATSGVHFASGDLMVCTKADGTCEVLATLPANKTTKIFIRPPEGYHAPAGHYTGAIDLSSNEGGISSSSIVLDSSSAGAKRLGVFLVVLGSLLSLIFSTWLRTFLSRSQLLQPAAALAARFRALKTLMDSGAVKALQAPYATDALDNWIAKLAPATLEQDGLAPTVVSLTLPSPVQAQTYQQRLDRAGAWLYVLDHMVRLGFLPIAELYRSPGLTATQQTLLGDQTTVIDRVLAGLSIEAGPPLLSTADTTVQTAVSAARNALTLAPAGGGANFSETDTLRFAANAASALTLIWIAVVTSIVGSYVMVLSRLDFGRPTDLWLCLIWGFGLPTVTQITQATPSSLAASFGVSLPKSP